jgi:hypothetical protein
VRGLVGDHVRLRETKSTFDRVLVDCLLGPDRELLASLLDPRRAAVAAYCAARDPWALRRAASARARDAPVWTAWRLASVELWLRALASEPVVSEAYVGNYETARPERLIRDRYLRPSPTDVSRKSTAPNETNAPIPASPQLNPDCEARRSALTSSPTSR